MRKKLPLPSREFLHECFVYHSDTGQLQWKTRPREHFKSNKEWLRFNTVLAGKFTGTKRHIRGGQPSCIAVVICRIAYLAHRVIWVMQGNDDPRQLIIDHRDGNPFNNRYENLRLATASQNAQNAKKKSGTTSRLKGASMSASESGHAKPWVAQMGLNGKPKYLGRFATEEEAHQAYCDAVKKHHGEFARVA